MNLGLWLVDNHFLLAIIDRLNTHSCVIYLSCAVLTCTSVQCQLTISSVGCSNVTMM